MTIHWFFYNQYLLNNQVQSSSSFFLYYQRMKSFWVLLHCWIPRLFQYNSMNLIQKNIQGRSIDYLFSSLKRLRASFSHLTINKLCFPILLRIFPSSTILYVLVQLVVAQCYMVISDYNLILPSIYLFSKDQNLLLSTTQYERKIWRIGDDILNNVQSKLYN